MICVHFYHVFGQKYPLPRHMSCVEEGGNVYLPRKGVSKNALMIFLSVSLIHCSKKARVFVLSSLLMTPQFAFLSFINLFFSCLCVIRKTEQERFRVDIHLENEKVSWIWFSFSSLKGHWYCETHLINRKSKASENQP